MSYKEPNISYKEPNINYKEQNINYQEHNMRYQEPNISYKEPQISYKETNVSYKEPNIIYEPNVVTYKAESIHASPQFESSQFRTKETVLPYNYNEPFEIQKQENFVVYQTKEHDEGVKRNAMPNETFVNRTEVIIKPTETSNHENNYRSVAGKKP